MRAGGGGGCVHVYTEIMFLFLHPFCFFSTQRGEQHALTESSVGVFLFYFLPLQPTTTFFFFSIYMCVTQSGEKHALGVGGGKRGVLLAGIPRRPDAAVDEAVHLPQRGHQRYRLESVSFFLVTAALSYHIIPPSCRFLSCDTACDMACVVCSQVTYVACFGSTQLSSPR